MSEELLQNGLSKKNPTSKIGKWDFYNIGATSVKALKEYGIIRSIDYGKNERKKVDALIVQQKNVIAVIEYKKPSEFKTDAQKKKAINQEIEVAQALQCKIIIATDTVDTVWVNALTGKKIIDEKGNEIKDLFDPKNEKIVQLIEKINDSISDKNNTLKPKKLINPTDLAKQIWQDVWSVSGATPENCLYTFVELFIFKYLSDLGVLKTIHSFDYLINIFKENTEDEVLDYYATQVRPKIKTLFPADRNDKTTIINGTIFVSKDQKAVAGYSTVFKKVLEKFEKYGRLENIEPDFKSQLFESFLKESISKKNWGQFFTPLKVIRAITEIAKDEIKPGSKICDPACGVGKFLLEPISKKLNEFFPVENNVLKSKITIHGFDKGFDKDEQKTIILAKANMLIYFSDLIKENPSITNQFADVFNDSFTLKTNSILGTLSEPIENEYDLILTNPPYVTSGSSNLKEEIKKDGELVNYFKVNGMGVEGLFMEWIVKALKPGGKAFIVVPDGIFNRQNDKNLRQFILDECYIDGIISLPLNTFFTTSKKTYILAITKKTNKTDIQNDPVFTYLVSEIGESRNIYRFDIEQNDLQEAITLYSFFKGNKQNFEKINSDERCKIQPIEKFQKSINNSWIIDKWWTEEDKIKLGIIEKQNKVSLLEFASIVEDVADSMKGLQEEIKEISEKKNSDIEYKSFFIKDLFDLEKGLSKYTKNYGNQNKGEYPVYSASNIAPLTYINSFDFEGEYLTWATNGFAGYIKVISNKFSINGDRGLLKPKQKNININYVKYKLEPILRELAKGRKGENGENEFTKVYPSMVSDIKIDFPVNSNGKINIELQSEIVDEFVFIEEIKQKVEDYKKKINELNVEIKDNEQENKLVKIDDIFEILGEDNLTKTYINSNKGEYPVYSGQIENGGIFGFINTYKYNETILTWVTYGNSGNIRKRSGKFNIGRNNCGLRLLDKNIDLDYIKHIAEPVFIDSAKGEKQKSLPQSIVKKIKIKIPVDKNSSYNIKAQKEISEKYKKIEEIKTTIKMELDKISEIKVDL